MKLVYSRRALADLDGISAHYAASASPAIADLVGRRLEDVIDRICRVPQSSPRVSQRSEVRVATVVRYPVPIFYRVREDTIDILHIRHTSRRPVNKID